MSIFEQFLFAYFCFGRIQYEKFVFFFSNNFRRAGLKDEHQKNTVLFLQSITSPITITLTSKLGFSGLTRRLLVAPTKDSNSNQQLYLFSFPDCFSNRINGRSKSASENRPIISANLLASRT